MKCTKSPTATRLTKHMVTRLGQRQDDLETKLSQAISLLNGNLSMTLDRQQQLLTDRLNNQAVELSTAMTAFSTQLAQQERKLNERLRKQDKRMDAALEASTRQLTKELGPFLAAAKSGDGAAPGGTEPTSSSQVGASLPKGRPTEVPRCKPSSRDFLSLAPKPKRPMAFETLEGPSVFASGEGDDMSTASTENRGGGPAAAAEPVSF
eukprot:SRR837773.21166.p2 GENE.SRR837773.21166~~SRR837773.21166.p2  ORF type:complete len:208 (-),score=63.61 SRR837773.21166:28-651(-)